jgi:hypothetical protein
MNAIIGTVGRLYFERQATGKTGPQLAQILEEGGRNLVARFQQVPQTEQNHRFITHIIGIEKWSQQRTQVLQGAPFRDDEYDVYRPPKNTSWDDLKTMFEQTRQVSVALARSLSSVQLSQKVRHNTYGELTGGAWLIYIHTHGNLESRRLR